MVTYIHFGDYPGAAPFISDPGRWKNYVSDSLIESTIARDILLLERIDKPGVKRSLIVGEGGMPLEEFCGRRRRNWFERAGTFFKTF